MHYNVTFNKTNRCSGPPLSVAPLPPKFAPVFGGRGDYDEYRGEVEDPYARVLYGQDRNRTKRLPQSQSQSRLQSHQGQDFIH